MSLADLTVGDVNEIIALWADGFDPENPEQDPNFFNKEIGSSAWTEWEWSHPENHPELGAIEIVEEYGGEGQGEKYYYVFKCTQGDTVRHFRVDGYWQSYDGGEYERMKETHPEKRTITVYE